MNYQNTARIILGVIVGFWGIFALFSGATEPGFMGIVKNSPNAIPFLLLGGLYYWAWKRPFSGGIAVMVLGCLLFVLFKMYRVFTGDFEPFLIILTVFLPIEATGVLFILSCRSEPSE